VFCQAFSRSSLYDLQNISIVHRTGVLATARNDVRGVPPRAVGGAGDSGIGYRRNEEEERRGRQDTAGARKLRARRSKKGAGGRDQLFFEVTAKKAAAS